LGKRKWRCLFLNNSASVSDGFTGSSWEETTNTKGIYIFSLEIGMCLRVVVEVMWRTRQERTIVLYNVRVVFKGC
jgi:hypothetical protein